MILREWLSTRSATESVATGSTGEVVGVVVVVVVVVVAAVAVDGLVVAVTAAPSPLVRGVIFLC